MTETINKGIIVIGALLIQFCLGAIYTWSVFVNPLKKMGFTTLQTQIIFSIALAIFAIVMIFAGKWQDNAGPRKVAITGGIFLGLGYILAGISNGSFIILVLTIGIISGAGIGLSYVCTIACIVKWFPNNRELLIGLAVAGFGIGAWIFEKLASYLIKLKGVLVTFYNLGIIFLGIIIFSSIFLKNPSEACNPQKWHNRKGSKKSVFLQNYTWKKILASGQFWILWLMFLFGATAGLLVLGNLKPFGIFSGIDPDIAGSAIGILALFNALGRISWGWISNKLGKTKSMFLMFLLQGNMMLYLTKMGSTALLLTIAVALIGFNFGGNFVLFPLATVDIFGTRNFGINYGLLFTSYGIAGIVGPILGGKVFDVTGSYLFAFIFAGILCLFAAILSFFIEKPKKFIYSF